MYKSIIPMIFQMIFRVFQEVSNALAGGLSRVEEEDVEAELEELIRADNARDIERLPDVPERRQG